MSKVKCRWELADVLRFNRLSAAEVTRLLVSDYSDEYHARARNKRRYIVRTIPGTLMVDTVSGASWIEALRRADQKWFNNEVAK